MDSRCMIKYLSVSKITELELVWQDGIIIWLNSFYISQNFSAGYSASFGLVLSLTNITDKSFFRFTVNYGLHVNKFGYLYPQYNYNGYVRIQKVRNDFKNQSGFCVR